jgi:adenosylmethionine-8-amino-7-oxononanoate aminotransferase
MKAHGAPGDAATPDDTPLVAIASAEGPWLTDVEGRRYLDGISSWWTNLFGHGHPAIRTALVDQLSRLDHTMLAGLTHPPVVELSERLAALTGLGHAFYASDGASATEIALKMSAHHWRNAGRPAKNRFVALQGGYHGETAGALGVTDIALFRAAYAPLVRLAATVPSPDARGAEGAETAADVALRAAAALDAWLADHYAETAAVILEPLVQCATGMAMHDPACARRATPATATASTSSSTRSPPASAAPARCSRTSRPASGPTSSACPRA